MSGEMLHLQHCDMNSVFEEVIADENSKNIVIYCCDGIVKMHRVMLGACSQFLKEILEKDQFHMSSLTLHDFDCNTMNVFLKFIHNGVVVENSQIIDNLRELAAVFQLGMVTECIPASVNSTNSMGGNSEEKNEGTGQRVTRRNRSESVHFSGDNEKSKKLPSSSSKDPLKRTCRMNTRLQEKYLICNICSGHYDNSHELNEHRKTHAELTCRKCKKTFTEELTLHLHACPNTEKRKCACECGQIFGNFGALSNHKKIHSTLPQKPKIVQRKSIECALCSRTYSSKDTLRVHMRTHTGEKPYMCPECGKKFSELTNMRCHQRSHSNEKAYVCECGKAFKRKASYKEHQFVHTGERPYVCDICGKSFRMRSGFTVHMRTHTGYKPYQCECGMEFNQKSNFERHRQKKMHYGPVSPEDMEFVERHGDETAT